MYHTRDKFRNKVYPGDIAIGDVSPLLDLDPLVSMLLDAGEDVNSSGAERISLAATAFHGHQSTVKMLLELRHSSERIYSTRK